MIKGNVSAKLGLYFTAADKLNRVCRYRIVGIDRKNPMRKYILRNITQSEQTEVEQKWFEQREITDVHR